jgi:serine/threonine-protein kinase
MSVTSTPVAGDVLGGCRLDRLAARGGMGVVWEATQLALGRRVALKVISPQLADDPEFRARFVREARVAASVHHPNIVDVYDAGEQDGLLWLAMRFVDGTDLRSVLRTEDPLSPRRAVRITGQVGSALDAAHAAGLIHRDVTPSNILLSGSGTDEHAALTDFGLVKHIDTAGVTRSGTWFGTLAFVAPEALRDEPVDGRTDVYALGCVLHRMLTGQVPYPRESDAAMIAAHLHDVPPCPSELAGVGRAFDAVIARALAKDPAERFASAGDLAAAARAALSAPDDVPADAPPAASGPAAAHERTAVAPPAADVTRRAGPVAERTLHRRPAGASGTPTATPAPAASPPGRSRGRRVLLIGLAALAGAGLGVAADRALDDPPAPRQRPAVPRTPAKVVLTPYRTPGFTAQVPRGWRLVVDDVDRGGFRESRWIAPAPFRARLAITYRVGSPATPRGIAEAGRSRIAVVPTYSEVAFGPIELNGDEAYRWIYGIAGQARAVWTLNPCGTAVTITAGTRPAELLRWSPTFRAVTASVRPACA